MGDLWLSHQHQFLGANRVDRLNVERFSNPNEWVELVLDEGLTPHEMAERAYRRYKKAKNRREASLRMSEQSRHELVALEAELNALEAGTLAPDAIGAGLKTLASESYGPNKPERLSYRRFTSTHGYPLWVGRSQEENAQLTFREARPDDVWCHAKQVPGSHVVLFCGKTQPPLEDLLDAAELAVFYSSAQHSSMVPVDYTRRKSVKKRPHGKLGQVLYRQEKTLYITPDADRLKRLGAVKEKRGESDFRE
jgi:predicted ribosome quality control (RQC) complex YloA/Tae2 family protein